MIKTKSYASISPDLNLLPYSFNRRDPGPTDVLIEILFCGICRSDISYATNELGCTVYPVVPGHEIIGQVISVGDKVTSFKKGDRVGVGPLVDSCGHCLDCLDGQEQCCDSAVQTYNFTDRHTGNTTYGGYSQYIVVDERFVLKIPENLDLASTAALCSSMTTYSALNLQKMKKGARVGVVGIGGLGHMAIKFARAMGYYVVAFTSSENKIKDIQRIGANKVVLTENLEEIQKFKCYFDFILNTLPVEYDFSKYLELVARDGSICTVGSAGVNISRNHNISLSSGFLNVKRRKLVGSRISGMKEAQEMLNFCSEHNITADIELIPIQYINKAYERMINNDVKFKFVIDMKTL
jgi:uncharacterized zinc-type alcohol dehydrogenase-like protein